MPGWPPALRGTVDAIVYSGCGGQFRSHAYVRALAGAQLRGSMGWVGAGADNAAMESFFSLLQTNVLNRQRWATREQLRLRSASGSRRPTTAAGGKTPSTA